ncbi:hypothetical protein G5V58_21055 [Nocardioides anomalus]|uniref:Uncharacterized protein n=1 Tax=Nocardioides anomalus TaxID=2712223 RepID=A0A6G6WHX1_9ACTN|nr:hypothetical protein [Nocardioides anomalus]QIG44928.1 hypothetical protein G5V58_21055 [Nocardioides anomalus]
MKPLLAVAGLVAAAALAPQPAEALQAPTLTAVATPDASYPQEVALNGDSEDIEFVVTSTEATTVTTTATGAGLSVTPRAPQPVTAGRQEGFRVAVTATTPGMHSLTVTFSAPGATPVAVTLPYVFAEGSPLPPSGGSLAGRSYGWMGSQNYMEGSTRATDLLSFVNDSYAYVGLPPAGLPTCKAAGKGCEPYSYDPATGVVQVGDDIVGKVLGEALATDGWIVADEQVPEQFASYTASDPLTFPDAGTRLSGRWHYRYHNYPVGIWAQSLTLRKDGSYDLYFQVEDRGEHHHYVGRYTVGRHGRITFKAHGSVVEKGTLALVGARLGEPKPKKLGLWLVLSGVKGKHGDGNRLDPVRK